MDTQTAELIKQIGVTGVMLLIILLAFRKLLDNQSDVIKANSKAQEASAAVLQSMVNYLNQSTAQLGLIQQAFEAHTKAESAASKEEAEAQKAFVEALTQNTKTLLESQKATLEALNHAMTEMRGAQTKIVNDVTARIVQSETKTGQAITDAQTANRAQHSEQTEGMTRTMNELKNALDANGAARKAQYEAIEQQLEAINNAINALRIETTQRNEQVQQQLTKFSDAFDKLKQALTPPADPPQPDPLANVPPKAPEEGK